MTKQTEAMRLALEALEETVHWRTTGVGRPPEQTAMDAIAALREELAEQPAQQQELCPSCRNGSIYACTCTFKPAQQEPVAYMSQDGDFYAPDEIVCVSKLKILTALYTSPPAQQGSGTEWLVCPKCSHQSPYTVVKAKTLAEEAELITKQARAALAQMKPAQQEPFVVKHYLSDERPTIKGNGFDGLEIGVYREEAEEFVAWLNDRLAKAA